MKVTRRQFVKGGVAAFTVTFAAPEFLSDLARAQGAHVRNLVVLYMSGGNDSLSMLDEVRFLSRERKDLKSDEIFRMATLNGASALGFEGVLGRLRRGYWADMTVLSLPENTSSKYLISQILEGAGECIGTVVQGEIAWRK